MINSDLLAYRLIEYGVNGEFYKVTILWGVKQGDALSPMLFAIYLNDLAKEIESLNCALMFGREISILLYTDDTVLLAPSGDKMQQMLKWVVVF